MSFTKTARNGDVMAPKGSTGGLFSLPEPGVPSVSNVPFPLKSRGGTRTRPDYRAQNSTDQKHHFGWGHQRSCSRATRHAAQADENASLATSPIRLVARGGQGNLTDLAQELPFFHRVLCASTVRTAESVGRCLPQSQSVRKKASPPVVLSPSQETRHEPLPRTPRRQHSFRLQLL